MRAERYLNLSVFSAAQLHTLHSVLSLVQPFRQTAPLVTHTVVVSSCFLMHIPKFSLRASILVLGTFCVTCIHQLMLAIIVIRVLFKAAVSTWDSAEPSECMQRLSHLC